MNERSEKKRKKLQQVRLTIQEEQDLIARQIAELNETQEVRDQIAAVLRNTYLGRYGEEPGPSGSKGRNQPESESGEEEYEGEDSDSSLDRLADRFGQDLDVHQELEKKELERKELEKKGYDKKKETEKKAPAPRSSAPPAQPAERPQWIQEDGTLRPFKEVHKLSQWSEEGSSEVYVSCLRCHKTIHGAQAYSLWAHVESKRCYPQNAIRGWRKQAKEQEQEAKIQEAHRATAEEAARKMQQAWDKGEMPQQFRVQPPPQRPAAVVHLKGDEEIVEVTNFDTNDTAVCGQVGEERLECELYSKKSQYEPRWSHIANWKSWWSV